jgi:hypothetical protein
MGQGHPSRQPETGLTYRSYASINFARLRVCVAGHAAGAGRAPATATVVTASWLCGLFREHRPLPDSRGAANNSLFDYLVGERDQCRRDIDAECPRGREVDHKLKLGRLLYRQVARFLAAKDTIDI